MKPVCVIPVPVLSIKTLVLPSVLLALSSLVSVPLKDTSLVSAHQAHPATVPVSHQLLVLL